MYASQCRDLERSPSPSASPSWLSQAQQRYRDGTQKMLEQWFNEEPFEEANYIVREGELASQYQ